MTKSTTTTTTIPIQVLLFASAREAAGDLSSTTIHLPQNQADTSTLRNHLATQFPKLAASLVDNITLAVNEEYIKAGEIRTLKVGDVVALIPPISGG